ncbi:phosphate transport system permease protein PstA [Methylococcaceae bacterium]|nr:phosphate transport system permease protein PstA [Methylococcaceae bacterium]
MIKIWFKSGSPWIWLNAAAVSICLIMVVGVLGLVALRGAGHFWASPIVQFSYQDDDGQVKDIIGEHVDTTITSALMAKSSGYKLADNEDVLIQYLIKTGNRDLTDADFRWIQERRVKSQAMPADMIVVERREWGNFYGQLTGVKEGNTVIASGESAWEMLQARLKITLALHEQITHLEKIEIGAINYGFEQLRLKQHRLELKNQWNAQTAKEFTDKKSTYDIDYKKYQAQLAELYQKIRRDSLVATTEDGTELVIPLLKVVEVTQPNKMGVFTKIGHYFKKLGEFLSEDPREANMEGGIFPAIFGTIMMVIMMSIIVTPFGVIAAVYLREYAKQGFTTRLIRIAVNNLAGVPSIVYGVFGLGFFVYILGGNIDKLFFPEASPAPVFGTPGLLWASITLALLTLPVVIVSTEEGLARVPKAIREGSLALGATKIETLWRTVLPMASPAMMTGLILAVARAAGEVAPLMLVGVVKLAPTLPLDGNYPFLHLDRKFMHLGFHIYDVGFQSPNVEAARSLVYGTSLLLVLVIIGLNLAAILIRNHLREKYRALEG